jgi:hypothetical protein
MKAYVRTESGSLYVIDEDAAEWARVETTADSGPLRTDGGAITSVHDMKIGERMLILGPPIAAATCARCIMTTPVVSISLEKQ